MENLIQLEALCERLYKSQNSAERSYAENTLRCFSQDMNYIPQLDYILENSRNPYAVLFSSSSLFKHVTDHSLPLQLRLQICNHVMNYLASRSADLEHFVTTSLIRLVCRVAKVGWFDDDKFQEIVGDSVNFLNQQEASHYAIGLKVLNQLVTEINQPTPGLSMMSHRKVANMFKEQALTQIYGISLTSLSGLKNDAQQKLQELALSLSLQCLSFDFAGMVADETDEIGIIQAPHSWRPFLEETSTVQIYFDYYAVTSPPLSKLALECLVHLASIKRSLFTNNATRMTFITSLMMGTKDILETGKGLNHHENYHELCRLLGRFKVNYQLTELVSVEVFNVWIGLVSDFTLKSLQSWKWTSSSVYYLLGLWSRMVTSLPYMKERSANYRLDELVPKILEGFVSSRIDSLQAGITDNLSEDPLDKVELMQDQLEFFPDLFRFQYEICSTNLTNVMDPILQEYMEGTKLQEYVTSINIEIVETKLAWMVHIVAAILRIKQYSGGESNELIDADLAARVLQLINIMDTELYVQRYGELSRQRLELAVLNFFQSFRKTYIGDQTLHASKQLYLRLSELLGLHDHLLILDVMVQKIAKNLKFCSESEEVLDQTLALFLEMASGYMSGKFLLKLDTIQYITVNHSREHFLFLKDYSSRRRTNFYYIIGLLVFVEDNIAKFKLAMDPFHQVFVNLESVPDSMFRDETVKFALVGLMRDLRGVAMATNSRKAYAFLFDWLYPAHMPLLLKALATWVDSPEVTTSLLKFIAELVYNRGQRLAFDQSSPNGILLFREVSKLIVAYGSRMLALPNQKDVYRTKYKGIWVSLSICTRAITGNYVNFGVFELYGDRALDDALDNAFKMILSIPAADILAYRKVSSAYYHFIEVLLNKLIKVSFNLDGTTFKNVVISFHSGLKLLESSIVSQCASAIDHLATFYFNHIIMGESPASPALLKFARHISDCGDIFLDILKTMFEIVLFEENTIQWGLSRPMLSLILLSEDMYTKLSTQIVASQPMDQQQHILHCFDILMEDVTRGLETPNRDRFTRNLGKFKKEFRGK